MFYKNDAALNTNCDNCIYVFWVCIYAVRSNFKPTFEFWYTLPALNH